MTDYGRSDALVSVKRGIVAGCVMADQKTKPTDQSVNGFLDKIAALVAARVFVMVAAGWSRA